MPNFKVCCPLKLRIGLTGNYHAIYHYSYNLPLAVILTEKTETKQLKMSEYIINVNREYPQIDVLNIDWNDYNKIMKSLGLLIELIESNKIENDIYYEQNRIRLLAEYKELNEKLTSSQIPSKGQAVSIDDNVIEMVKNS